MAFTVSADPHYTAYNAYGLIRASLNKIWHPKVVAKYVKTALNGFKMKKPKPKEDLSQLGGDFIIDERGVIQYAYTSTRPDDRPDVTELLTACKTLTAISA